MSKAGLDDLRMLLLRNEDGGVRMAEVVEAAGLADGTAHGREPNASTEDELYNIVDEDGTLKFRYIEGWSELGWYRLTEDQPYQGSFGGE